MSVTIVSPKSDDVVKGLVRIAVTAPGVKRINFWIDGKSVFPDPTSPFIYDWDTTKYAEGQHTIKAISGNGRQSASIYVKVQNIPVVVIPPPDPTPPPTPPTGPDYRNNGPLGDRIPLPKAGTCGLAMQTGGIGWWPKDSRPIWLKRAKDAGLAPAGPANVPAFFGYGYHYDGSYAQVWNGVHTVEDPYYIANMAGGDGLTHEQFAINHGAVPIVAWQPGYTLVDINNGLADSAYVQYANYWKTFAPNIILWRPFVEFNLPNPYGIAPGGVATPANCAAFIAAWRHMVNIVSSIADNVGYIYNPDEGNRRDYINSSYPGDAYVDLGGSDIYNWCAAGSKGNCWSAPPPWDGPADFAKLTNYSNGVGLKVWDGTKEVVLWSQYDIFGSGKANRADMLQVPGYGIHQDLPTKKPFIVCETGQVWHSDADTAFKAASFPKYLTDPDGVKAMDHMAYFMPYDAQVDYYPNYNHQYPTDATYPGPNNGSPTGDNNWMVDYPNTHPEIGAGFTKFASDPYMRGR